jgi:hypothetical protein
VLRKCSFFPIFNVSKRSFFFIFFFFFINTIKIYIKALIAARFSLFLLLLSLISYPISTMDHLNTTGHPNASGSPHHEVQIDDDQGQTILPVYDDRKTDRPFGENLEKEGSPQLNAVTEDEKEAFSSDDDKFTISKFMDRYRSWIRSVLLPV